MDVAGFGIGALGLLLALVSLGGEVVKRPRLDVRPARWAGTGQHAWEFLVVRLHNKPATPCIAWLFTRRSADGCRASLTFTTEGESRPAIDQIPARWSAAPEPISYQPDGRAIPDPTLVPNSYRLDVAADTVGEEIAVARSMNGSVYAFSAESYLHGWRKPGWELKPGQWTLLVRTTASDASLQGRLSFEVAEDGSLRWLT